SRNLVEYAALRRRNSAARRRAAGSHRALRLRRQADQRGGVIQVSEKARNAVLIRRSRKFLWIILPGNGAPFIVIVPRRASTNTLYIWCCPVADIAGATSTANGSARSSQRMTIWTPSPEIVSWWNLVRS